MRVFLNSLQAIIRESQSEKIRNIRKQGNLSIPYDANIEERENESPFTIKPEIKRPRIKKK